MRSLHSFIKQEYGQDSIFLLPQWEKLEIKMANYRNHHRFTIKCLKNDIIPVSVRLKTNIHTTKGLQIIRRAEKQLLNEHIRSINNLLEMFMIKRDACFLKLKGLVDQETLEERDNIIKKVVESRHIRVLGRQKSKYEALHQQKIGGHSNNVYRTSNARSHTCTEQQMHVLDNTKTQKMLRSG